MNTGPVVLSNEINQLRAENAALITERDLNVRQANVYMDENRRLKAELAEAKKDAERYRWLRSNHPIHDNSPFICRNFGAAFSQWTDDQADKAIDTAIAASREGKS